MQALLQEALLPVNIVFTVLLIFVLLYWSTVLLGIIDISAFDVEVELEADVDIEADTDVEGHHGGSGWLGQSLQFFNFGRVPFMVVTSFLTLSMWALSILGNYYWGHGSWTIALILLIPNLAVSLLITKLITTPLVPLFRHFDGSAKPVDYIGRECTLTLPVSGNTLGQAEVLIDDTPLLVSVKLKDTHSLERGTKALIVGTEEDGKYYLIKQIDF
jgi:hypothetical protein